MKKKLIIISFITLLFVGAGIWIFFSQKTTPNSLEDSSQNFFSLPSFQKNEFQPPKLSSTEKEKNLSFQTQKGIVRVMDFYKDAPLVLDTGDALFKETPSYSLHYNVGERKFSILLLDFETKELIQKAENDLRETLGITKGELCTLQPFIFIDRGFNTQGKGRFPLSFCPN